MWGGDSGQGEQDDRKPSSPSSPPMVLATNGPRHQWKKWAGAGGSFDVPGT